MLPLECEKILKSIEKKFFTKEKKLGDWNIMLFENKTSGFRETIFYKGKLLFTRVLNLDADKEIEFASSFKTNNLRTVEYLKRFSKDFDDSKTNIFAILSKGKKEELTKLGDKKIKCFTPKEFGVIFGVKNLDKYQQDYCDVLMQRLVMRKSRLISFSNAEMKELKTFSNILAFLQALKNTSLISVVILTVIAVLFVSRSNNELLKAKKNFNIKSKEVEQRKKREFGDKSDNLDEMLEIVSFYDMLALRQTKPFDFIKKFADNSVGIVMINDIRWEKRNTAKHDIENKVKSMFSIAGVIVNETGKVDDLFKIYENYNRKIRSEFANFEVIISNMPKNINFNESYKYFPIRMDFVER
jgi:hypothetical protein